MPTPLLLQKIRSFIGALFLAKVLITESDQHAAVEWACSAFYAHFDIFDYFEVTFVFDQPHTTVFLECSY